MALLEVDRLTKRFGGLVANDNVSLTVEQGEIVGLIGPNGAGKTTLFNCIAGFYTPDSGTIRFQGRDITGSTPEQVCREGIARTFQIVRVFKGMTVLDNVMVGAYLRTGDNRAVLGRALEVLHFTGLLPKKEMLASALTIADKKRLELARALATRPKLLMLDEAMAGLNPSECQEAVEIIRAINAEGVTILMVEHVMEIIMPISNRLVVLDYGKKIDDGAPDRVAKNPEVIKAYLGEKYVARGR
ncbi:MAG: ABC transporter ATP-binding protein [Sphingomonadaceae bacterium]